MGRGAAGLLLASIAVVACHAAAEPPIGSTRVSIELPNGETLDAYEMGGGPNVAVLSHGATGTKEGFYPLMPLLAEAGWHAIAYDAEGVGASTGERGGNRQGDLEAVVEYARDAGAERIALIGASQGAFVSLASAKAVDADGVVALSAYAPSTAHGGNGFSGRLGRGIPLMLAVAEDNPPYTSDVRALGDRFQVKPIIVTGSQHGTGMFTDHPELMDDVVAFLETQVA